MTPRVVRHWIGRLGFVGGMALVLAGCPEDAADITEFASDPSWNFPVASSYLAPTGPFTVDRLAPLDGGERPDSLSVTYTGLEELVGGAVYEAWLVNPGTGASIPAVGTYNLIQIVPEFDPITGVVVATHDSLIEEATVTGTASFAGGFQEYGFRHRLTVSDGTLPGGAEDTVGFYTHLVLTLTSSAGGTALPSTRAFWFHYTDQNDTPDDYADDSFWMSGSTSFGNFDATDPTLSRPYSGQGQGTGGFREDELVVEMLRLSRPPVGYQLVGWLIDKDGAVYRLPDVTGPPPERLSLVNADVEDVPELTTRNGILEANFRALEGTLGVVWSDMRIFLLTLEPKLGNTGIGPILVQVGAVPPPIIEGGD